MLANQIAFFRRQARMSQLQLAKKLNIGPSAIGMYEQGRRTPSVDLLIDMANLFGVSLDYLITGKEPVDITVGQNDRSMRPHCPCQAYCRCFHRQTIAHDNPQPDCCYVDNVY